MPMWNAITTARACRAGLALVILSASLAKADFGPRTTIGKNYQQTSSTVSSVFGFDPGSCNDVGGCRVLFQPIPQQQRLIIQHVACGANVSAGGLEGVFLATRKGQTIKDRRTFLVPVSTTGGRWAVNNPVMHLIKSGERPFVQFANSTLADWAVECSISGKLR